MTKVDIYSGFLGAGKTTLIKKMIQEAYAGQKLVLIENEFGEIGIDGGFLQDAGINITEMNSGCICCSLVGDFGKALQQVIDELRNEPGALMPIMQRAQDIFGYLPEEVQNYIAKELDIPVSDIYGVATFYAQFNLEPKGKYIISVCMGTACYVKGSQQVLDKLEDPFPSAYR